MANYCAGCLTCQMNKDGRCKPLENPQPLELPDRRKRLVSDDSMTHLLVTKKAFDYIKTNVDRFSKRIHHVPSHDSDTAEDVATAFFENVLELHRLPNSTVSDKDPKFISSFWTQLMDLCGIKLRIASSRHTQTDGSTEIMNRMAANYLRCYCSYQQDDWENFSSSAESAYNSSRNESLQMTPFEVNLGWNPRSPLNVMCKSQDISIRNVEDLKKQISACSDDALFALKFGQARQYAYNARRYTRPSYRVEDEVFLSPKLFTTAASKAQQSRKLGVKKYGSFKIVE